MSTKTTHKSVKYTKCAQVMKQVPLEGVGDKSHRTICVAKFCDREIMGNEVMTPAGASTYYANLKQNGYDLAGAVAAVVTEQEYSSAIFTKDGKAKEVKVFKVDTQAFVDAYERKGAVVKGVQAEGHVYGVLCVKDEAGVWKAPTPEVAHQEEVAKMQVFAEAEKV